jgi:mannose-6-phosphate isomerase-like protein (cupin superfamily)
MQIKITDALGKLTDSGSTFLELFSNRNVGVEIYKPVNKDNQEPHDRDEIYIIVAGRGHFYLEETKYEFAPADFFFVPAGKAHKFTNFTEDFSTWVNFLNN